MRRIELITLICVLFAAPLAADMTVTTLSEGQTLDGLIGTLLGPGVTISNASYTGASTSSGTYTTTGTSVIGIPTGVVMTSGNANYAEHTTNTSDTLSYSAGGAGNALLNTLIPGYSTHDATILAFDFELGGDGTGNVYINYAFASEEYNEWVGSAYNDVFGFFVDGVNIALIPGTSTPVAINNVNNSLNSAYYNDNDPGTFGGPATTTPVALEYDGFTDVLTGSAAINTPGLHHMLIGVADAGDWIYDSAVFIQGGSFSNEPQPVVPLPGAVLLGLLGMGAAGLKLRRFA